MKMKTKTLPSKKKVSAPESILKTPFKAPKIVMADPPKKHAPTKEELVEVPDLNLAVTMDLKRQPEEVVSRALIEDGQKLFPYTVQSLLMIGWQQVGFISSLELKLSSEHPLPSLIVRFIEKMPPEEVEKLAPETRKAIEAQMAIVRQYPFVQIESPLIP